jgi:hypothetical protein
MAFAVQPAVADGAIAVELSPGVSAPGYGIGQAATAPLADRQALKLCRAANPETSYACKIVVRYLQCGAVAVSPTFHFGHGVGPNPGMARFNAMLACGLGCEIVVADCVQ